MGFFSKASKKFKRFLDKAGDKVKRYAAPVLAAAAIVFTAGAAMGVVAGGWGAIAGGLGAKLGTGVLANVVTGAITQAGYGAALGGAISKAQGGSFREGANRGAVTGAMTGGLMGGLGMQTDPFAGIGEGGQQGMQMSMADVGGDVGVQSINPIHGQGMSMTNASQPAYLGGTDTMVGQATSAVPGAAQPRGLMAGAGQWVEKNPTLTGHIVSGLGQALGAQANANDAKQLSKQEQRRIQQNYQGTGLGLNSGRIAPTAQQSRYSYGYEYRFNPQSGRIERQAFEA
jgi:hypothetical protein